MKEKEGRLVARLIVWFFALVIVIITMSCSEDPCTETAGIQYIEADRSVSTDAYIIHEDTCIDGDIWFENLTPMVVRAGVTLTVMGEIEIGTITMHEGSVVRSSGFIKVIGDVYMTGYATIENDFGWLVTGKVEDVSGTNAGGEIIWCNKNQVSDGISESITITEDCENLVECHSLSDGGLGIHDSGKTKEIPCGFDYANQKVKYDCGRPYIYIEL